MSAAANDNEIVDDPTVDEIMERLEAVAEFFLEQESQTARRFACSAMADLLAKMDNALTDELKRAAQ